jgi:co-chaperonin GroES (HSP10)
MKFIPYPDKILIKPIKDETFLAQQSERIEEKGKVIAVGIDVKFVEKGDIVYFNAWGHKLIRGEDIDLPEESYYLVSEIPEFILGKVAKHKKKEDESEEQSL